MATSDGDTGNSKGEANGHQDSAMEDGGEGPVKPQVRIRDTRPYPSGFPAEVGCLTVVIFIGQHNQHCKLAESASCRTAGHYQSDVREFPNEQGI